MTVRATCTLLLLLFALARCEAVDSAAEEQLVPEATDESELTELSDADIKAASQPASDTKLIELLEDRKRKELEDRARARSADDPASREADAYHAAMQERNSWLFEHKSRLVHASLLLLAIGIFALVSYKAYAVKQHVERQNAQVQLYAEQLEKMGDNGSALKHLTWKDQKEGILFTDNPAYTRRAAPDLPAAELVQRDLDKLNAELEKQSAELEMLRRKEDAYIAEIEQLKQEYERTKKEVLEEGAVLADGEGVMREYN